MYQILKAQINEHHGTPIYGCRRILHVNNTGPTTWAWYIYQDTNPAPTARIWSTRTGHQFVGGEEDWNYAGTTNSNNNHHTYHWWWTPEHDMTPEEWYVAHTPHLAGP